MTPRLLAVLVATLIGIGSCQRLPLLRPGDADAPAAESAPPPHTPRLLGGLGSHSHPISTQSELAQRYFDQGMVLTYGFNHGGAIDAFEEAARQDPDCAMCFWGVAYAYGPNINAPMGPAGATAAWAALQEARRRLPHASPSEREYIEALTARYAPDPQPADRSGLDAAYAAAMRGLHQRYPDDLDAAALSAEAIMDQHPWDYWTEDGTPREGPSRRPRTIDCVLARDPWHPGANHFQIHIYEEFQPERAEAAADRLRSIAPDAGHLVHMPAHIYWRVGRYQDAIRVNELAVASDVAYLTWCRTQPFYAASYLTHNLHFLWAAASAEGASDEAITNARRLAASVPVHLIAQFPPIEDFLTVPVLTLVRFGRFDAVLAEPKPPESQRYHDGALALRAGRRPGAPRPPGGGGDGGRRLRGDRVRPRLGDDDLDRGPARPALRRGEAPPRRRDRRDPQGPRYRRRGARGGRRRPGQAQLHRAAGLLLPDAPGPRRRADRRQAAGRRRGRLPQGPRAVPEERLVALRPHPGPRRPEEDPRSALGRRGLRPRLGARGREAQRLALLSRGQMAGQGHRAMRVTNRDIGVRNVEGGTMRAKPSAGAATEASTE